MNGVVLAHIEPHRMKRFLFALLSILILSACSAAPPSTPTPHLITSPIPPPVATITATLSATLPTEPVLNLREIPQRYAPMVPLPINTCPFVSNEQIEDLIGSLTETPVTMVTFQPPFYENRASIRCEAHSENNTVFLDVWFAPDSEIAQADYIEVKTLTDGEAINIQGLGEDSFWWQNGLRLETVSGDSRLTIALSSPIEDTANQTALLAAQVLETINPENGFTQPQEIIQPIGVTDPEFVNVGDLAPTGEFFEACNLLSLEEFEKTLGPLNYPLKSGSSIGELEPFDMYDCVTDPLEPGGWMYLSLVFGDTAGDMILHYRRGAVTYPANATPMDNVGDEAWYWYSPDGSNLNLSILRANVMLVVNVLSVDSYESRGQVRSLARLILDRLFEQR